MVPGTPLDRAGSRLARETLKLYVRYAELTTLQEEALDNGDLESLGALDEELRAVQDQIGSPRDVANGLRGDAQADSMRSKATESLRKAQATHARIQARLASLKEEEGNDIRRLVRGSSQARRYLEAATSDEDGDTTHIDVTL